MFKGVYKSIWGTANLLTLDVFNIGDHRQRLRWRYLSHATFTKMNIGTADQQYSLRSKGPR